MHPVYLRLPCPLRFGPAPRAYFSPAAAAVATIASSGDNSGSSDLTPRERRQLRQERRESRAGEPNWREEVEERLSRRRKKNETPWTEEININLLARLGPQWWILRVSRAPNAGGDTAGRVARSLARHFPDLAFKIFYPSIDEKRILKNGTVATKSRPLYPGCVFLHCVLNKEVHDFIRECDGVGGFLGSKVGNEKRQIMKPKPVPPDEMEAVFKQAKEEQDKADEEFEGKKTKDAAASSSDSAGELNLEIPTKVKGRSRKGVSSGRANAKLLVPGAIVRVLSGPFKDFTGCIEEVNLKTRKASVGITLFGKESSVDLGLDQIDAVGV